MQKNFLHLLKAMAAQGTQENMVAAWTSNLFNKAAEKIIAIDSEKNQETQS